MLEVIVFDTAVHGTRTSVNMGEEPFAYWAQDRPFRTCAYGWHSGPMKSDDGWQKENDSINLCKQLCDAQLSTGPQAEFRFSLRHQWGKGQRRLLPAHPVPLLTVCMSLMWLNINSASR